MRQPVIVIVGMGPGIASAVASRFGQEGFHIAMIARREDKLAVHQHALREAGIDASYAVADAADPEALSRALAALEEARGGATVLLYNAAHIKWKGILDETAQSLVEDFKVNVAGALTAVHAVLPAMRQALRYDYFHGVPVCHPAIEPVRVAVHRQGGYPQHGVRHR